MASDEPNLWELYKRKVAAGAGKKARVRGAVKAAPEKAAARKAAEHAPLKPAKTVTASLPTQKLERRREKILRDGSFIVDAKLDLHGMTQVEAFAALTLFMHRKVKAGKRHLLIITGKGRGGTGALRSNLQNWLAQVPEAGQILALRQAAPAHGGDGAFYVVMRKS